MFRGKVIVTKYQDKDYTRLRVLLTKFRDEVYGVSDKLIDVDAFIETHEATGIYFIKHGELVVGFLAYYYNTDFGFREPTLSCNYVYIEKGYRKGSAIHAVATHQIGFALKCGISLEHYYASEHSRPFHNRMEGKELYRAYVFGTDTLRKQYDKLNKEKE